MLTIRHEQVEFFERLQFEEMHRRIERAIAATFPETCAAPADGATPRVYEPNQYAKGLIENGIEHAVNLGILERADLAAFIALGLALRASALPPPDWISSWLARPEAAGPTRLAIIEHQLAELAANDPVLQVVAERVRAARREAAL